MCVDYTDLIMACPKDPYPLPNIDLLIDSVSGFKTLSFLDAYSGYNHIRMDPLEAPKTAFMTNNKNYHYEVMSFGLRYAGTTFQRSMDTMFAAQIGRNMEVYIDDLVVKTPKSAAHTTDFGEIFQQVRKFNMRLNPTKCTFGVQARKFLGFFLTSRGIEANPDKCQAIINMRSTCRLIQIFVVRWRQGVRLFCLYQEEKFEWTSACEEAFTNIKEFLSSPPVLHRPSSGATLSLYLSISDNAMSSVLTEDS